MELFKRLLTMAASTTEMQSEWMDRFLTILTSPVTPDTVKGLRDSLDKLYNDWSYKEDVDSARRVFLHKEGGVKVRTFLKQCLTCDKPGQDESIVKNMRHVRVRVYDILWFKLAGSCYGSTQTRNDVRQSILDTGVLQTATQDINHVTTHPDEYTLFQKEVVGNAVDLLCQCCKHPSQSVKEEIHTLIVNMEVPVNAVVYYYCMEGLSTLDTPCQIITTCAGWMDTCKYDEEFMLTFPAPFDEQFDYVDYNTDVEALFSFFKSRVVTDENKCTLTRGLKPHSRHLVDILTEGDDIEKAIVTEVLEGLCGHDCETCGKCNTDYIKNILSDAKSGKLVAQNMFNAISEQAEKVSDWKMRTFNCIIDHNVNLDTCKTIGNKLGLDDYEIVKLSLMAILAATCDATNKHNMLDILQDLCKSDKNETENVNMDCGSDSPDGTNCTSENGTEADSSYRDAFSIVACDSAPHRDTFPQTGRTVSKFDWPNPINLIKKQNSSLPVVHQEQTNQFIPQAPTPTMRNQRAHCLTDFISSHSMHHMPHPSRLPFIPPVMPYDPTLYSSVPMNTTPPQTQKTTAGLVQSSINQPEYALTSPPVSLPLQLVSPVEQSTRVVITQNPTTCYLGSSLQNNTSPFTFNNTGTLGNINSETVRNTDNIESLIHTVNAPDSLSLTQPVPASNYPSTPENVSCTYAVPHNDSSGPSIELGPNPANEDGQPTEISQDILQRVEKKLRKKGKTGNLQKFINLTLENLFPNQLHQLSVKKARGSKNTINDELLKHIIAQAKELCGKPKKIAIEGAMRQRLNNAQKTHEYKQNKKK